MQSTQLPRLIQFLNNELAIPISSIDLAMRYHSTPPVLKIRQRTENRRQKNEEKLSSLYCELQLMASVLKIDARMQDTPDAQRDFDFLSCEQSFVASNHLPMILWQYGLITLEQLDLIFDWLETRRNYETINYEL